MNSHVKKDNAAQRRSYVGDVYNKGEGARKKEILKSLKPEWEKLHNEGYIHIHDLDAYGLTYNCLTFDSSKVFPYDNFIALADENKIIGTFDFIKELLEKLGNEQSGGMAFANFDIEIATILSRLNVDFKGNNALLHASLRSFILWCNNIYTRMGQTTYYISLNVGLGTTEAERFICSALIEEFMNTKDTVFKPNIIFKVKEGVNKNGNDPNYDLLKKALLCSAKKMIPTYLLCDCESDRNINPLKLSVMGCRTRVVDDLFGETGAVGRGNIDNISINLPRLALEVNTLKGAGEQKRLKLFKEKWLKVAAEVTELLLHRFRLTCASDFDLFPLNRELGLWCTPFEKDNLVETYKHGTLSLGFIGLSEAVELLTGNKFWEDEAANKVAKQILSFMREFTDAMRDKHHLNFSLLATSGELISGRFPEIDKKSFFAECLKKGFYTNSFHVDVDSRLPAHRKLQIEGPFHRYANGGSISYVELAEAPLGNVEGLYELMDIAVKAGVRYLGFNYPKDLCKSCGTSGTFDSCSNCGSKNILRIRRVSGYLEIQDFFTSGKFKESKKRKANS